ncbi:LOW QUALITY PROTEIN: WW domain-binding protein 2 [Drosophila sulfurigaster albostrigata]|uniref:LOW QUALITY PROTEIN: WW domain-binding protein 2 n=1 Tax=Drosophila sulfurigaster albostrigata TaxID=89887 RepID=UPI002D219F1F|nr:LOW QUALITY PROTEIN: WW domain-binding protein 2 [Drosophila sulfurigaster albostrigata]
MWYFLGIPLRHRNTQCVHTVYDSSAVVSSRKLRTKTTRKKNAVYKKSVKSLLFRALQKLFGMSINTAHANNGVLIHAGEYILLHSDSVTMDFSGQDNPLFQGSKQGRIYLTSHRMIFNNKKPADTMQSFSAPFVALSDVEIEQPVFGANYIKGKVRAQPNGNYVGEVKFKLYFKAGGAIEYGQALLRAAKTAQGNFHRGGLAGDDPPPYAPAGAWHEAPPPAYQPPPGYYGWLPQHDAFSGPAPNTVYISDNPPPYPGITPQPHQQPYQQPYQQPQQPPQQQPTEPTWYGFSAPPDQQPQQPQQPGYGAQGWNGGYAQPPPYASVGGPAGGPPYGGGVPAQVYGGGPAAPYGGYNPNIPSGFMQPGLQPAGYPGQQPNGYPGGMPPQQQPGGYPPQQQPGGYPPQQQPTASGSAANAAGGAASANFMGFSLPPGNSKEAEAAASAYNTPYNQGPSAPGANDLPPSYNNLPPSYDDASKKHQ